MSNYMVYLLFVNPEMLIAGTRRNIFTAAHDELDKFLKDEDLPPGERAVTQRIIAKMLRSSQDTQKGFIQDAWMLALVLVDLGDDKMWEVIEGVWVEMLCFSASRCRGYLHAKVSRHQRGVTHLCMAAAVAYRDGDLAGKAAEGGGIKLRRKCQSLQRLPPC
jgi:hypothetical protein